MATRSLTEMTGHDIPFHWKKFFGKSYKRAEAQIITCKGYFKTDPSAWANAIDVFIDLLLDSLHRHEPALGIYTLGRGGSILDNPVRLKAAYPLLTQMAQQFHDKRLESNTLLKRIPSFSMKLDYLCSVVWFDRGWRICSLEYFVNDGSLND